MALSPGFCRGLVQREKTSVGLEAAAEDGGGGRCGGRKEKCMKKNVDFRAFLWFILDVETTGLPNRPVECVPPGGSRAPTLGKPAAQDSVTARDVLWINRVPSGREKKTI